jgi:hypothetical protein
MDSEARAFRQIRYFNFDEFNAEAELNTVLEEINGEGFSRVFVCASYSRALLVPQKFFSAEFSLLEAVYDVPDDRHLYDKISEWQIITAYCLPLSIYQLVMNKFPVARFVHAYTTSLKMGVPIEGADQITLHFTTNQFRLMVKKGSHLHLAETYSYKTPLDVVYYLLKVCYEFNMDQKNTYLVISGLVDEDSALYQQIHHYFLNLHLAPQPQYELPDSGHPYYYFTSLYNLAACAS